MIKYGNGGINSSNLLASYVHKPTYWLDSQITVDLTADTFTITGNTLVVGDSVTIAHVKGAISTTIAPTPLLIGRTYFVRQVVGNAFRLATANNDTTLIDFTAQGTAGGWRLEKISGISTVSFTGLSESRVRILMKNGGWATTFGGMNFKLNGVGDAGLYTNIHGSNASLANSSAYVGFTGTLPVAKVMAQVDVTVNANIGFFTNLFSYFLQDNAGIIGTGNPSIGYSSTYPDTRFDKIHQLDFIGNTSFLGDLTLEVYRL